MKKKNKMHNKKLIVGTMLITALLLGIVTISTGQIYDNVQIVLSPTNVLNRVGTNHTVTAIVTADGLPLAGLTVAFSIISGPNSRVNYTSITDSSGEATYTYTDIGGVGIDEIQAFVFQQGTGSVVSNIVTKEWITSAKGFMTGVGSIFQGDNINKYRKGVTHKFELQCDTIFGPNNLEVGWSGNKFHLEKLDSVYCYDNPSIGFPSKAGFDTYKGSGTGRYNGVYGATASWKFTDGGKSGRGDRAEIFVTDVNGNIVLAVSGKLDRGNQQAHK